MIEFKKIDFGLRYERSLNLQQVSSREYFPWEMKVDKLYLNIISFSIRYKLNKNSYNKS